jgi:hypothetical protein
MARSAAGRRGGIALGTLALAFAVTSAVPAAGAPRSNAAEHKGAVKIDYVALGDSYSAGPLIPTQRPDPANCLRSYNNYPAYLAGYLGVATYRDVTCSGARVRDLSHTQTTVVPGPYNPPPQLESLSKGTDIVTVGIGGNDFGLFSAVTGKCSALAAGDPLGAPCTAYFTNSRGVNTKYRDARRIQKHVARGLAAIHAAAPDAMVYVVGYPRLLPQSGTCTAVGFATGDYPFARKVEFLLNRSLRRAAGADDAVYIGTYHDSRGHDACAGADAWINGQKMTATAAAYHPNQTGERGMGRTVFHRITGYTAPDGGDASPPLGALILNQPPST